MAWKYVVFATFIQFLILFTGSLADQTRFDNFRVYSVNIESAAQRNALNELSRSVSTPLDFWKGDTEVNAVADIMVDPVDQEIFEAAMIKDEFKWKLKVENVQFLIDNEQPKTRAAGRMDWAEYHPLEEIYAWMDQLLVEYPDILTDIRYGFSVEGRPLRGVKLSKRAGNKAILIESNTHAREWITPATTTHFLNQLLTSTNSDMIFLANTYDWLIFPTVNPDGYVYSMENNRMWRKNRAQHGLICLGTDPNRNWGYEWATGAPGSSDNVCDETYTGPSAFSEPETRNLAEFITANAGYIKMVFSFHSYSQLILYPWSYTSDPSSDMELLHELAQIAADEIKGVHGVEYTPQASFGLYPHHGTIIDWTYGAENILLSFTIEFRDTGAFGFILPANQIIPNAEEIQRGVISFVQESVARGLLPLYPEED